jgi:hypothetical protein
MKKRKEVLINKEAWGFLIHNISNLTQLIWDPKLRRVGQQEEE